MQPADSPLMFSDADPLVGLSIPNPTTAMTHNVMFNENLIFFYLSSKISIPGKEKVER